MIQYRHLHEVRSLQWESDGQREHYRVPTDDYDDSLPHPIPGWFPFYPVPGEGVCLWPQLLLADYTIQVLFHPKIMQKITITVRIKATKTFLRGKIFFFGEMDQYSRCSSERKTGAEEVINKAIWWKCFLFYGKNDSSAHTLLHF